MSKEEDGKDGNTNSEVVKLSSEQLKTLSKLIHYQEVNRIKSIAFKSERDRGQYLRDSRDAHQKTVALMEEAADLHRKYTDNETTGEMALRYLRHVEMFFSTGLRLIWNLHLRIELIKKMQEHCKSEVIPKIKSIRERVMSGEFDVAEIEAAEVEAREVIQKLVEFENLHEQIAIDRETVGPRNFSKTFHKDMTFEKLVKKHQEKLVREKGPEYGGEFEELNDVQKIEVFDDIRVSYGRKSLLKAKGPLLLGAVGVALLVVTIGLTVWDICRSNHKLQTAAEEGIPLLASIAGSFAGEALGGAIGGAIAGTTVAAETAAAIATCVGVEVAAVSSAFVCLAACATGIGLAIALGALTGWLVCKIIESGGNHASNVVTVEGQGSKPRKLPPKSMKNIRVYVAPMPNGSLLARQLAYQGDKEKAF